MRAAAAAESAIVVVLSECGRLAGMAFRRELPWGILRRFEWFVWREGQMAMNIERGRRRAKIAIWASLVAVWAAAGPAAGPR